MADEKAQKKGEKRARLRIKVVEEFMSTERSYVDDLQTLVEDVRRTKLRLFKPLAHLDLVSTTVPLSSTRGSTRVNSRFFRRRLRIPKLAFT